MVTSTSMKGVIFGTLAAARHMTSQRPESDPASAMGHIINMASIAGCVPLAGMSLYSARNTRCVDSRSRSGTSSAPRACAVTVVCPTA